MNGWAMIRNVIYGQHRTYMVNKKSVIILPWCPILYLKLLCKDLRNLELQAGRRKVCPTVSFLRTVVHFMDIRERNWPSKSFNSNELIFI